MDTKELFQTNDDFKQKLAKIKEYILALLWRKKQKIQEEVKSQVDDILQEKPSFLDKLKNLFGKEDKKPQTPPDKYESHSTDRDEYIPRDSEFGESVWESPRFAEIYPGIKGYFQSGKKSYFDPTTNLWSKRKKLSPLKLTPDTTKKSYTYAGTVVWGTVSIPLPDGALPDISTLTFSKSTPYFQIDQNNCIYLTSKEKQYISFKFYTWQSIISPAPILEDSEKIVYAKLTKYTRNLLSNITNLSSVQKAQAIQNYISKEKKYSTRLQGTLRDKSNEKNYIVHLDESEVLECFSANSLFVALCREANIPSRLVVGHMIQSLDKDGKWLLSSNNGHAWSEIWDGQKWVRFDATPTKKEDGEDSEQNMNEQDNWQSWDQSGNEGDAGNQGQGWEENNSWDASWWQQPGENQSWESANGEQKWEWGEWWSSQSAWEKDGPQSWKQQNWKQNQSEKSPQEALKELIDKAREDNLAREWEKLKETIEKLEQAQTKEQIKEILDKAWLSDFAKEMVDKVGNEEIFKQEQQEIQKLDDEKKVDQYLEKSLLNEEFKSDLHDYAREIKKKIQEEKKKMLSDMQKMWFREEEMRLYKLYKELEIEIAPEIKKQIKALEKILPPIFHTVPNEDEYFASGHKLWDTGKLIEYELTGDNKIFRREKEKKNSNEINMFETIIIDRSGSMGRFEERNSALREAVKAAIIRAKVLEHFKVNFSIIIFDTKLEEVMEFGETFSSKKKNNIPSRLMRAVMKSDGTDIGQPLTYTFSAMKKYAKKIWGKAFGNISFLGDGEPTDGLKDSPLQMLIEEIRNEGFGLTAYYINGSSQQRNELQKYFGSEESWGTVIVPNVKELTEKLIGSYNANLKKIIKKYVK